MDLSKTSSPKILSRSERGSAVLAAIFFTLSLAAVTIAWAVDVNTTIRSQANRAQMAQAKYWAIQALAEAKLSLREGGNGLLEGNILTGEVHPANEALGQEPGEGMPHTGTPELSDAVRARDHGDFRTNVISLDDGSLLVEAAAKTGDVVRHVVAVVQEQRRDAFSVAIRASNDIRIGTTSGPLFSDSYRSDSGTYDSQATNTTTIGASVVAYAGSEGSLAAGGSIDLASGGTVFGDVRPGPLGVLSGLLSLLTGTTLPSPGEAATLPVPYDPPATNDNGVLPSTVYDNGHFLPVFSNADLPAGTYVFQSYTSYLSTVRVKGDVTIYMEGPMAIWSDSSLLIEPGASLRIFSRSNVYLQGHGIKNRSDGWGTPGSPLACRIYVTPSENAVTPPRLVLDATNPYAGTIYAPSSEVRLSGELYGAVVGRLVTLGPLRIHFDVALRGDNDAAPEQVGYQTLAWWVMP